GAEAIGSAGFASRDVEEFDWLDDRILFPEALRAEAFVNGTLRPAFDTEHVRAVSIGPALLKCWRACHGPSISTRKAISIRRRVGRGRFLTGLGLGVSLLGLVGKLSRTILAIGRATGKPFGDPVVALLAVSVGLTGPGILLGIGSHTLMGHYALMLKKHAKRIWRRWRKSRRPTNRSSKS